ncbi:hypothetical protein ILUMI_14151, partial [Ignelater luminosus]
MPKRRSPPSTVGKRNAAACAAKLCKQKKSAKRIANEILEMILHRVDNETPSSTKVSKNSLNEIVDDVSKLEVSPVKLNSLPTNICNNSNEQDFTLPNEDNYTFFSDRNLIEECTREDPNKKPVLNKAVVWATLATGRTYTHSAELFSVLDVPFLSSNMFYDIQRELGENVIESAGKLEREAAIKNGDFETGNFTVYLDGVWSKRSYGHTYNAFSGV